MLVKSVASRFFYSNYSNYSDYSDYRGDDRGDGRGGATALGTGKD